MAANENGNGNAGDTTAAAPPNGPSRQDRPVARIVLAAGVLPLLVVLASAALVAGWRDDLPVPLANHWDGAGNADGFTSYGGMLAFILGFGGVWAVAGLVLALVTQVSVLARFAAGTGAGTAAFVAALAVFTVAGQRGLDDAADSDLGWWTLPATVGVGLVIGLVVAALIPRWKTARTDDGGDSGRPVDLAPSERVFWARTVASPKMTIALMAIAIPGTAAPVLFTRQWALLSFTLVLVALVACLAAVRVTVDDRGLLVRGLLRWPRIRVELADIASARVVSVKALRDFGGYGLRFGFHGEARGAFGFVLRSGEALLVNRRDGARTVVVVDDAHTAAGLLNALVDRAA